jgi:hypothetical protein
MVLEEEHKLEEDPDELIENVPPVGESSKLGMETSIPQQGG